MAQRSLVLRERMTALVGILLLTALVGMSYYYSIRIQLDGLKYVPSEKSPDFIAKSMVMTDFDPAGQLTRRLLADNVEHYSDGRMNATDARVQGFGKNRAPVYLSSDKAWTVDSLATLELSGNVRVYQPAYGKNPDMTLKTEYVKAFLDNDYFETDRPVFLSRGRDTTQAQSGMRFDNVTRTVELEGKVFSVFHPTSGSKTAAKPAKQKK